MHSMEPSASSKPDKPIAAVILAAGRSSRFGKPKVLQSFKGQPFLTRISQPLNTLDLNPIILVLGYKARWLQQALPQSHISQIIINEQFDYGQFSSLQSAVRIMPEPISGLLVCLIDQPHLHPSTYERIVHKARHQPECIIIPKYQQKKGHPVYLPKVLMDDILKAPPESRLDTMIKKRQNVMRLIEVDDPGILQDIDTPSDLQRIEQQE
ncbi:MAG: NTP transferase domain-containing protein [Caldithrix sp.]|nr:NTP transferase domain-containing protein [Caldithrix sp.]